MLIIKALLSGLTGFSLCSADISGIVTDTSGTIPLSGATVKLERGGQTAMTAVDGRFALVVGSAILSGPGNRLIKSGLSATTHRGLLYVNVTEKSAVEIAFFNLNGKALSTVRKTMDAGMHSIALPQRGAGVYLYKVKSGSNELLLKANSIEGGSQGSGESVQGFLA